MKKVLTIILLILLSTLLVSCDKEEKKGKQIIAKNEKMETQAILKDMVLTIQRSIPKKRVKTEAEKKEEIKMKNKLIVIDAGHQKQGDNSPEPIGPGASETKPKVASGTTGVATGIREYELNLAVSLKLEAALKNRGYKVIMIRTTNDVSMSNAERAEVANQSHADMLLRIHANGSENASIKGALTMCMTPNNPYNANLYNQSRKLSELVLNSICGATGAIKGDIIETDTMTGINWSKIPVTIVEMGYMSNAEEDTQMNNPEYQNKMAQGIADGVDLYFKE